MKQIFGINLIGSGAVFRAGLRFFASNLPSIIISLALIFGDANPAISQTSADVVASQDQGYGRLIFDFDKLPTYNVQVASNILIITFDEDVSFDASRLERDLSNFVSAGRLDPDRLGIRFALTQAISVNTIEAGDKLFVDLMPVGWQGLPPSLPQEVIAELTLRAEEAEVRARRKALEALELESNAEITVSSGEHPTFSRISFDWNVPFTARLSRDGSTVSIAFNKLAVSDLNRLVAARPKGLISVTSERTERGLIINMEVERTVTVRAFTDGNSYVVDLADVIGPGSDLELSAEDLNRTGLTQFPGENIEADASARRPEPIVEPEISASLSNFDPLDFADNDYADWLVTDVENSVDIVNVGQTTLPQTMSEDAGVQPGSAGDRDDHDASISNSHEVNAGGVPADTAAPVKVHSENVERGVRITFDFPEQVRAAVFQRNGAVWAMFESSDSIELGNLANKLSSRVNDISIVRAGQVQYVKFDMKIASLTSVVGRDQSWFVTIGDLALDASVPLEIRRERGSSGLPRAVVELDDTSSVHWIDDAALGGRMAVVMAYGPARGLIKRQEFVEFVAFPSAHGLAIQPLADDLRISLQIDEVIITRGDGLWLSATGNVTAVRALEDLARTQPGFINFKANLEGGPDTYIYRRRELSVAAASAEGEDQEVARIELARFYLAHGLGAEALGVLRQIEVDNGRLGSSAILNALTAIANVLMTRTNEADIAFRAPGVGTGPDIMLWRGLNEGLKDNWVEAQMHIESGEHLIWEYPQELRAWMHLTAVRGALIRNDFDGANHHLAILEDIGGTRSQYAERQYLRGRYLEATARSGLAGEAYDLAIRQGVRSISAEARLRKIQINVADQSLSREEAVSQLEGLSMGWRGNNVELEVLNVLADLYVEGRNFRRLFEVMASASTLRSESSVVDDLRGKIEVAFKELFLEGGADSLPPIEALSLFYEYRVLTPIGREGDEIIRKLAERLVSVDLLEQAASLLTHQVEERLNGVARAQVATRLAAIHLMNRNPADAIRVLRRTRLAELPAEILRQRKLIEARAYSASGRMELALDILSTMDGDDVERLKADTYWLARAWQSAAEQLERVLGDTWKQEEPLADGQRYDVMRAAVSYALANDDLGLERLRTKFAQAMSNSPDSHSFTVVTGPIQPDATEFRELARQIASVSTLEAFLDDMQSRSINQIGDLGANGG